MYYEEEASQQEIAERMKLSRVSVCRMLKAGREQGMVVIQVHSPNHVEYGRIERQVEEYYGLKEVLVVENTLCSARYDHMTAVGSAANRLLEAYIKDGDVIGVGFGKLLHGVGCCPRPGVGKVKCTFVPMMGGIHKACGFNATQVASRLAQIFGGNYLECFSPALFTDESIGKSLMSEPCIKCLVDSYHDMKTAIFEISASSEMTTLLKDCGWINKTEQQNLSDAAGALMMQFFDNNGNPEQYETFNKRVVGMPLDMLNHVENRIGISSGETSVAAAIGALKAGLVNMLVTDEECATGLIELYNND